MKNLKIIVARYNENLDWLKNIDGTIADVQVYNKGTGKFGNKLKNVGREAHTFLHYLISEREFVYDTSVFLQGDPFPHIKFDLFKNLQEVPKLANPYFGFDCLVTKAIVTKNQFYRNGAKIFSEEDSRKIYEICQSIKPRNPDYNYTLWVSHFACFAVKKEAILKHPPELYQKLQDISVSSPFGPHALEMLWRGLFDDFSLL